MSCQRKTGGLARASGLAALAWLLTAFATAAGAASVVQVRVGRHPTFTRIVFELDAPAGYRIERPADDTDLVLVTLEASSEARDVESHSIAVESVRLEPVAGNAVARIALRRPRSQVREMMLANPPRIVLDVMLDEAQLAAARARPRTRSGAPAAGDSAAPAAGGTADFQTETAAAVVVETLPSDVAARPEPAAAESARAEELAAEAHADEPEPGSQADAAEALETAEATAEPAAEDADASEPMAEPERAQVAPADEARGSGLAEPGPTAGAEEIVAPENAPTETTAIAETETAETEATETGTPETAPTATAEMGAGPAAAGREGEPGEPAAEGARAGIAEREIAASRVEPPAPVRIRPERPTPQPEPAAAPGGLFGFDAALVTRGAIAGCALVALLVVVALVRRRSRREPLDVTTLAFDETGAEPDSSESPEASGFSFGEAPAEGEPSDASEDEEVAAEAAATPEPATSGEARLDEVDVRTEPGLFDETPKGEGEMEQEMDLPIARDEAMASPHLASAAPAAGAGDVAALVGQLTRRIEQLEARLDESNEARERLERQVAAQSEELRVQRAAIARTQRALRSLSRSEEEHVTEPALREPNR